MTATTATQTASPSAIQQRNLFQAEPALREMGTASLLVLLD